MKLKCVIDKVRYTDKPQGFEPAIITNRMTIDTVQEYSIEEIKESILDGKTIRPSYCGGKQESWKSQQLFMLDVDNKPEKPKGMKDADYKILCDEYLKNNHRTYNDIIKHCQAINIIPNFIYTSFSHNENHHKMRLVYVLDEEINDYIIAQKIQIFLMRSIGEVDATTCNINRFYYAGKNIVFDSGNVLDSNKIIEDSKDIQIKGYNTPKKKVKSDERVLGVLYNNEIELTSILSNTPKTPQPNQQNNDDYYTIKAINKRDIQYLKVKYGNGKKKIFETKQQFLDYIRREIDLGELLEFNYPKSIKCLFHDDNNNSASIFQADDGTWIYKCHSSKCNVTYNIIGVIERLAGFKSRPKTYKFIKEIFNLEIMETEWQKEQKEILQENIDVLYGDLNFQESCPQANKNINNIKHYLERLHSIAMKNVHNEELTDKNGDVVFFASGDYICREMGISKFSLNKVYLHMAQ